MIETTIIIFGQGGDGKSSFANASIEKIDAFKVSDGFESCTNKIQIEGNIVRDRKRNCIDTIGTESADNQDLQNIVNMVNSLNSLHVGINAFFLVISIENPRLNSPIQRLVTLLNNFFDDPICWRQAGIIFTKCNYLDDDLQSKMRKAHMYQQKLIEFIKTLPNCQNLNIQLPCYFVNSKKWETDDLTRKEIDKIFDFASGFIPNVHKFQYAALSIEESYDPRKVQNVILKTRENGQNTITTYAWGKNRTFNLNDDGKVSIPVSISLIEKEEFHLNGSFDSKERKNIPAQINYDFEQMMAFPVIPNQCLESRRDHRKRGWFNQRRKTTLYTQKLTIEVSGDFYFQYNNQQTQKIVIKSPHMGFCNQYDDKHDDTKALMIPQSIPLIIK